MPATPPDVQPGERIGDYDVLGIAGRGRASTVYRCTRGRDVVAVKLFHDGVSRDPMLRARIRRGAARAEKLAHRHLLRVHESGVHDGRVFVVTEWIAGTSLDRIIASGRRPSPKKAARTVEQLARAIAACHYEGVTHGALTPKAVLVDSRGDEPLIDDLERPLSTEAGDHRTAAEHVVRDLDYAAPWDVHARQTTPSGDIYALGCILHALLTGKPPARTGAVERRVSTRIPARVRTVIQRTLAETSGERYASASALAHDLDDAASTLPAVWPPDAPCSTEARRALIGHLAVPRLRGALVTGTAAVVVGVLWAGEKELGGRSGETAATPAPVARPVGAPAGKSATPATGGDVAEGPDGSAKRTSGHLTPRLRAALPAFWRPIVRARRTDTLVLEVRNVGRVRITYRAGHAPAPMVQVRAQRRLDRGGRDVQPLAVRRLKVGDTTVARYERRTDSRVQVQDRLRADRGQYDVVATAHGRAGARRLASIASRTIVEGAAVRSGGTGAVSTDEMPGGHNHRVAP